jgi:hypothetical protein
MVTVCSVTQQDRALRPTIFIFFTVFVQLSSYSSQSSFHYLHILHSLRPTIFIFFTVYTAVSPGIVLNQNIHNPVVHFGAFCVLCTHYGSYGYTVCISSVIVTRLESDCSATIGGQGKLAYCICLDVLCRQHCQFVTLPYLLNFMRRNL